MPSIGEPDDENLLTVVTREAVRQLSEVPALSLSDVKAWVKGLDKEDPVSYSFRRIALMNPGWYKVLWLRVLKEQGRAVQEV